MKYDTDERRKMTVVVKGEEKDGDTVRTSQSRGGTSNTSVGAKA